MKKMTLALVVGALGFSAINSASAVPLGYGTLDFRGSITESGCTVTGNDALGVGEFGDILVTMPAQLGKSEVTAANGATATVAFANLSDRVKRSVAVGDFNLGLECPVTDLISFISSTATDQASLLTELNGVSQKDRLILMPAGGQVAAVSGNSARNLPGTGLSQTGTSNYPVLKPIIGGTTQGEVGNVGIMVLRKASATDNVTPSVAAFADTYAGASGTVQDYKDLGWVAVGTDKVKTLVAFDFAYVTINTPVSSTTTGNIRHALPFQFIYE